MSVVDDSRVCGRANPLISRKVRLSQAGDAIGKQQEKSGTPAGYGRSASGLQPEVQGRSRLPIDFG